VPLHVRPGAQQQAEEEDERQTTTFRVLKDRYTGQATGKTIQRRHRPPGLRPDHRPDALRDVQAYYPEACIAGGALRDLLCNKPVKDIDVFISAKNVEGGMYGVREMLLALFGAPVNIIIGEALAEYSDALKDVAFTLETFIGDTPLQIIALHDDVTLESVVERIDFGICRVGTDGRRDLITEDFAYDLEHRQFTLRCNFNEPRLTRSKARHERLQAKFPGWPLVIPEQPTLDLGSLLGDLS
jgi:hypothetical protein